MSPEAAEETPVLCDYPDCQAANGGACALGHSSPDDCPEANGARQRAEAAREAAEPEAESSQSPETLPTGIELQGGRAMTVEEGNALASRHGARIIVPAGPSGAGKTTYLIELYAEFLKGKQFGASFVESQTLLEFDYLLFPSRLAEGNEVAETWRTRLQDSERSLLHLAIDSEPTGKSHLLMSNLTGELFEHVCDHGDAIAEVPLLGVADKLLIFMDGDKLRLGGTRASALSRTRQFINVLVEEKALSPQTEVALVTSKLDRLEAKEGALEGWVEQEARLLEELEALERPLRRFRIAPRPMGPTSGGRKDLEALFSWLLTNEPRPATSIAPPPASGRAIEGLTS